MQDHVTVMPKLNSGHILVNSKYKGQSDRSVWSVYSYTHAKCKNICTAMLITYLLTCVPNEDSNEPVHPYAFEDSDQNARMRRLI